ncbi:hypothetical protein K439DRAFT_913537 [Ramaria rubella]|nr:hypothetical protein K439DRAFT_913537 [Ramaria rubella]
MHRLGRLAWKSITDVVDFYEQKRMQSDQLFNSRVVRSPFNPTGIDMSDSQYYDAIALVPTNRLRELLNTKKAIANTANPNRIELITCAANDLVHNRPVPTATRSQLLTKDFSALQGSLPGFLPLYEGILRKIYTSLCPQALTYATSAFVEFPQSPIKLPNVPDHWFIVEPHSWSFTVTDLHRGRFEDEHSR